VVEPVTHIVTKSVIKVRKYRVGEIILERIDNSERITHNNEKRRDFLALKANDTGRLK
jgi:hypothetical protein